MNARLPFDAEDLQPLLSPTEAPSAVENAIQGISTSSFSGDLTNDSYHSLDDYISCSGLKALLRSPAHYQTYLDQRGTPSSKPNLGTATHCAVLEPYTFDDRYAVFDGRRSGKPWEAFKAIHGRKEILSRTEYEQVLGMREAILRFRELPLKQVLEMSVTEKSIFWTDEETGMKCRIRPDVMNPYGTFDLKTIDDCRPDKVMRQAMRMDYDLQAAMYQEGIKQFTGKTLPFIFMFAEDQKPHGVWLYTAGQSVIDSGMAKLRRGLSAFRQLRESKDWHGYLGAMSTLELPRYARQNASADDASYS